MIFVALSYVGDCRLSGSKKSVIIFLNGKTGFISLGELSALLNGSVAKIPIKSRYEEGEG